MHTIQVVFAITHTSFRTQAHRHTHTQRDTPHNYKPSEKRKQKRQNQRDDEPHTSTQQSRKRPILQRENFLAKNSLDEHIFFLVSLVFTFHINIMDSPAKRFTKQHSRINNEIQMCRPATCRLSFSFGFNCSSEIHSIHLAHQPTEKTIDNVCQSQIWIRRFLFRYLVLFIAFWLPHTPIHSMKLRWSRIIWTLFQDEKPNQR